jgi:multidrug resistance protein
MYYANAFEVTFDGPDDPENPKNWSKKTKWGATIIVSAFTFISPVSSSMAAPALGNIGRDLGATNQTVLTLSLSIFVLAYAVGPLFLGPLSEIYGRVIILQSANAFFLAFNIGCGFAQTIPQLIVFRFLAGLGGSAPLALGGGVLSDLYHAHERGRAISIYSLMPLLGPAVGPIAGGFIALTTTWRWCFWSTSILTVVVQAFGLIYLRETYAPRILGKKAKRLRQETGEQAWRTQFEKLSPTLGNALRTAFVRPFRLLGTQPIVQVMAVYQAYLYGLLYLVLTSFPIIFRSVYGFNSGIAGLNYISLGLGFFIGTQIGAVLTDRIYRRKLKQNNGVGKPEFRIPLMIPGACLVPIGLFIYGWTADAGVHWIAPNIGSFIFSLGSIMTFQGTQTFIVDSYQTYAASAIAACTTLRSLAGFGFPLFASSLYDALGLGWGNSLLGFLALGIGIPAPLALWRWGEMLRARSQFAAG